MVSKIFNKLKTGRDRLDPVQKAKYRLMYIFAGAVALAVVAANIFSSDDQVAEPSITQEEIHAPKEDRVIKTEQLSL
jgi:hypothetical protein